tara:strand:+ start:5003 stop:6427 length:1425 start_codon:yes stop_codon:yes gene_type:complete
MASERITFGEWLPDQSGLAGALTEAKNVIPVGSGYAPLPSTVELSDAADANLLTVFSGKINNLTTMFAASATKIYKFDTSDLDLDNVSKTGNYTTTTNWKFLQFGSLVIAANGQNKLQSFTLNSSSLFADLNASAPVAKFITAVRDFVVSGNISSYPNRVAWSDINDPDDWTSGSGSQSDVQDIPDGGDVQGITGGEFGIVFLEKSIVRMQYIGSPLFFQFDTISRNIGCYAPNSIVQYGNNSFFLSDDGFYVTNGQAVTPIGAEKVDRFFFDNANLSDLDGMSSAVDPVNKLVIWSYTNNSGTKSLLIYNWQLQRWSQGDATTDFIAGAAQGGITLEGLDVFSNSIDSLDTSLDSRIWAGGQFLLAGTESTKIVTYTGTNSTADIRTADIGSKGNSIIQLARPVVDSGSGSVSVASRQRADEEITFSSAVAASTENRVPLRSVGKYHRLKLTPTGNWKTVVGMDVEIASTGGR